MVSRNNSHIPESTHPSPTTKGRCWAGKEGAGGGRAGSLLPISPSPLPRPRTGWSRLSLGSSSLARPRSPPACCRAVRSWCCRGLSLGSRAGRLRGRRGGSPGPSPARPGLRASGGGGGFGCSAGSNSGPCAPSLAAQQRRGGRNATGWRPRTIVAYQAWPGAPPAPPPPAPPPPLLADPSRRKKNPLQARDSVAY